MIDAHSLADYSSHILNTSNTELEQRLGLYRVFLKLYEHHRGLLDEILQLENANDLSRIRASAQFVQGVVQGQQVFLSTNLLKGTTRSLFQPQRIWMIGRDGKLAVSVQDKRLSRRHAAIQYIEHRGFYLVDLNSTNGSFINGEPVRQAVLLKDGDQIRLGSITFNFFVCDVAQAVETLPPDIIDRVNAVRQEATSRLREEEAQIPAESDRDAPPGLDETSMFFLSRSSLEL